jgi:hypothetical protein
MFVVPEDSNCQDLLDYQLAHYFPAWEAHFDSSYNVFRTSQGCLDLLNWYIDLETRFEASLSSWLGLRYGNEFIGDYDRHINNHRFEPFFQIYPKLRIFFTITTHYYKGDNEIGLGYFIGADYLNYLELFVIADDFDRNFSLKDIAGPEKVVYKHHPIMLRTKFNRYWHTGHLFLKFDLSNRYILQSDENDPGPVPFYLERGQHRYLYTRLWQDIGRLRLGMIFDLKKSTFLEQDLISVFNNDEQDIIIEPSISYTISRKWRPALHFSYNNKMQYDSLHTYFTGEDSLLDYERDVYAYLIDMEFNPGGNIIWHAGMQREFYYNNQGREFTERRLLLGFEYRYKNIWFYFVEAMEGDFPTPKWLHNHTYVQLMARF